MLTAEQRSRYLEVLKNAGNRTRSELCRELGLSYLELSRVMAELGVKLPPARRDPARMNVPRAKLEEMIRAGMNRSQMQIALGLSNRGLMRLLKQYGLQVLSPAQRNRQYEAQGLRQCIECRQVKVLATDFYNDRTNPLGKNRRCKECLNRWSAWHRQRKKLAQAETEAKPSRTPWADQGLRRCRRCHQVKPLATEFPESPNERGGRSVYCRACHQLRKQQALEKQRANELAAQGLRQCSHCHQIKRLNEDFGVNRRDRLGRQTRCRDCQRALNQQKRQAVLRARAAQPDLLTTALLHSGGVRPTQAPRPQPTLVPTPPAPAPATPTSSASRPQPTVPTVSTGPQPANSPAARLSALSQASGSTDTPRAAA
jgi:hypothetical protein